MNTHADHTGSRTSETPHHMQNTHTTIMRAVWLLACTASACSAFSLAGPPPTTEEMLQRLSPVAIAYLGDSVFELAVRERFLWPPSKINDVNGRVMTVVRAEGQYAILCKLVDEFGLSETELEWVRRGRNASARGPRRLDPKVYRGSTSFEALVGYLHLTDKERLQSVLEFSLCVAEEVVAAAAAAALAAADESNET